MKKLLLLTFTFLTLSNHDFCGERTNFLNQEFTLQLPFASVTYQHGNNTVTRTFTNGNNTVVVVNQTEKNPYGTVLKQTLSASVNGKKIAEKDLETFSAKEAIEEQKNTD